MKTLSDIYYLFKRKLLEQFREPVWIISGVSSPLLYLAFFAPLLTDFAAGLNYKSAIDLFMPGMLTLFAFSAGMGEGWDIVMEYQAGIIERFCVTPASRVALTLSAAIKNSLIFVVSCVLVVIVAAITGFTVHLLGLVLLFILLSCFCALVGSASSALGMTIRTIGGLAAVATSVQLPITLLSGALLPLSTGPKWLSTLAHVNPMYYVVEAARKLSGGDILNFDVLIAFIMTISLLALTLWWSTRTFKKAAA